MCLELKPNNPHSCLIFILFAVHLCLLVRFNARDKISLDDVLFSTLFLRYYMQKFLTKNIWLVDYALVNNYAEYSSELCKFFRFFAVQF